jgi:DNA-binding HxlR family transcriptional regulator
VTTYGQFCPIAKATEILGERWSLLVIRELLIGSTRFNDIARGLPAMSRTMLSTRLKQLERVGLVERLDAEYHLTPAGQALRPIVFALGEWCVDWLLEEPATDELDPDVVMWWGHGRLDTSVLPDRRVVLQFDLTDHPNRYWIVVEDVGSSVCFTDPGYEVDAVVTTDVTTLHRMWQYKESVTDACRDGRVSFAGPPAITRRLPTVLTLSPAAEMGVGASSPRPRLHTP